MARPIKETPVLTGEDAKRFEERLNSVKPASEKELKRLEESFKILKKIAVFPI
jgi:hypothetical protein